MESDADIGLVNRTLGGERDAFGELVDRYQRVVYNLAYQVTGNEQDAEDVAQTVFLKVYERLGSYNPKYRFFSWLYRIAINESVNTKKSVRHSLELTDVTSSAESSPYDNIVSIDTEDKILHAILSLTPENRAIISLRHYQDFSYKEIAYIMDLTEKKVKSRLYSARQKLGQILTQKGLRSEL